MTPALPSDDSASRAEQSPAQPVTRPLDELEPVRLDNRKLFLAGTALWILAFVICGILALVTDAELTTALWVCGVGAILGVLAVLDARRRARPGYRGNA